VVTAETPPEQGATPSRWDWWLSVATMWLALGGVWLPTEDGSAEAGAGDAR
jgi:hypothetical protein